MRLPGPPVRPYCEARPDNFDPSPVISRPRRCKNPLLSGPADGLRQVLFMNRLLRSSYSPRLLLQPVMRHVAHFCCKAARASGPPFFSSIRREPADFQFKRESIAAMAQALYTQPAPQYEDSRASLAPQHYET